MRIREPGQNLFLLHLAKTIFCAQQISLAITLPYMWKFGNLSCLDLNHLHDFFFCLVIAAVEVIFHLLYDEILFLSLCRKPFSNHK